MTQIPEHLRQRAERARLAAGGTPTHTQMHGPLLTDEEHEALRMTADLAKLARRIIGNGPQANCDGQELVLYIHGVQHMILRNAAARAYPDLYRLLGESLK